MSQKRRRWSSAEKFEIAMKAAKNDTTLNELCAQYKVSPTQVHSWRKHLLEEGSQIFERGEKAAKKEVESEKKAEQMLQQIGQLTMEREYLKKAWRKLNPNNEWNS